MFVTLKKKILVQITWLVEKNKIANLQLRNQVLLFFLNALKRNRGPQYKDQWSNSILMVNIIKSTMSGRI